MYQLKLNKEVLQKYIDILPIGYYLGKNIHVDITNRDYSYYDFNKQIIMISYNQLNDLIYEKEPSKEEIERDVRCMLYHEVSHAILSPIEKINIDFDIFNIFCDERIETLLANYYLDVDFKSFVKRISNFKEEDKPKNPRDYFYRITRFRFGPKHLVDRVNKIIFDAKDISSSNPNTEFYTFNDYQNDINDFYKDCTKDFYENYEEEKEKKQEKKTTIMISIDNPNDDLREKIKEDSKDIKSFDSLVDLANALGVDQEELREKINEIVSNVLSTSRVEIDRDYHCNSNLKKKAFKEKVREILKQYKAKFKYNGLAKTTYSGRLNPRLTINNDYKWFIKTGDGYLNNGERLKLNLFVDTSGSFERNEAVVNDMLAELDNLEDEVDLFSYKLITMSTEMKIANDDNRRIKCAGGTSLSWDWGQTFNKVQDPKCRCINIVLFDGGCFSYRTKSVFSIFNKSNVIIISDEENRIPIGHFCKNIKKKFIVKDNSYIERLEDNLITSLKILIR